MEAQYTEDALEAEVRSPQSPSFAFFRDQGNTPKLKTFIMSRMSKEHTAEFPLQSPAISKPMPALEPLDYSAREGRQDSASPNSKLHPKKRPRLSDSYDTDHQTVIEAKDLPASPPDTPVSIFKFDDSDDLYDRLVRPTTTSTSPPAYGLGYLLNNFSPGPPSSVSLDSPKAPSAFMAVSSSRFAHEDAALPSGATLTKRKRSRSPEETMVNERLRATRPYSHTLASALDLTKAHIKPELTEIKRELIPIKPELAAAYARLHPPQRGTSMCGNSAYTHLRVADVTGAVSQSPLAHYPTHPGSVARHSLHPGGVAYPSDHPQGLPGPHRVVYPSGQHLGNPCGLRVPYPSGQARGTVHNRGQLHSLAPSAEQYRGTVPTLGQYRGEVPAVGHTQGSSSLLHKPQYTKSWGGARMEDPRRTEGRQGGSFVNTSVSVKDVCRTTSADRARDLTASSAMLSVPLVRQPPHSAPGRLSGGEGHNLLTPHHHHHHHHHHNHHHNPHQYHHRQVKQPHLIPALGSQSRRMPAEISYGYPTFNQDVSSSSVVTPSASSKNVEWFRQNNEDEQYHNKPIFKWTYQDVVDFMFKAWDELKCENLDINFAELSGSTGLNLLQLDENGFKQFSKSYGDQIYRYFLEYKRKEERRQSQVESHQQYFANSHLYPMAYELNGDGGARHPNMASRESPVACETSAPYEVRYETLDHRGLRYEDGNRNISSSMNYPTAAMKSYAPLSDLSSPVMPSGAPESISDHEHSNNEEEPKPEPPKKRGPGRPRKPENELKKKKKKTGRLWEFIRNLLLDPATCPSLVRWENPEEGMFRFVQAEKVAQKWGDRKQNKDMNYEKLSRAMRYYYKTEIFEAVLGRRLVYKFGKNAKNWRPTNPNFPDHQTR